jgi:hypothetical protein
VAVPVGGRHHHGVDLADHPVGFGVPVRAEPLAVPLDVFVVTHVAPVPDRTDRRSLVLLEQLAERFGVARADADEADLYHGF